MKTIVLTLLVLCTAFGWAATPTGSKDVWRHPAAETALRLLEGDFPDPSIVREGNTYYMVHSSFTYVPGLVIYKSDNLVDWEMYGRLICVCTIISSISIFRPGRLMARKRTWWSMPTIQKGHGVNR